MASRDYEAFGTSSTKSRKKFVCQNYFRTDYSTRKEWSKVSRTPQGFFAALAFYNTKRSCIICHEYYRQK